MKKFLKLSLCALGALCLVIPASSFVASVSEDSICIESVDGIQLDLSLAPSQLHGLYDILPDNCQKMLDDSYGRFRTKALATDYGQTFFVDGFRMICNHEEGGDLFTISCNDSNLGRHKVNVRVSSQGNFIDWMDGLILD